MQPIIRIPVILFVKIKCLFLFHSKLNYTKSYFNRKFELTFFFTNSYYIQNNSVEEFNENFIKTYKLDF
jgi:hypothetical protein